MMKNDEKYQFTTIFSSRQVKAVTNSYTQVVLASLPWGGLAICLSLCCCSPRYALAGLLATVGTCVLARVCREDTASVDQGLSGYNPLLTALAVVSLDRSWQGVLFAFIAAVVAYFVTRVMKKAFGPYPVLTAPFVLTAWAVFPLVSAWSAAHAGHPFWDAHLDVALCSGSLSGTVRSFGEIFLQDNLYFSFTVMVVMLFTSFRQALWVVATLALLFGAAFLLGWDTSLASGLLGYNPLLVAAALAAFPSPFSKSWQRVAEGVVTLLVSVAVSYYGLRLFGALGFPLYTAPFVVVTLLLLCFRRAFFSRR